MNFDRANVLVGSGAISKELFSDRKANFDVAVAARGAAEARLAAVLAPNALLVAGSPVKARAFVAERK